MKLRHIGIVVNDLNNSLKFWKNNFNLKVIKSAKEQGETIDQMLGYKNCKIKTVKMINKSGLSLELIEFLKPKRIKKEIKTNYNGITHFALEVKNLDEFYKKNKNKIKFNCSPQISKDLKVKVLYAKTPENSFIELVQKLR